MAKQKADDYPKVLGDGLKGFRNRTGKTQAEVSFSLNGGKPCNVGTYRNIEGGTRPAGFIPFRKMAKYFLGKGKDIKMVKTLLRYAALDPAALLRMLVADAWIRVEDELPNIPEGKGVDDIIVTFLYYAQEEFGGSQTRVCEARFDYLGRWWISGIGFVKDGDPNTKIIAWQPLPAAFVADGDKGE